MPHHRVRPAGGLQAFHEIVDTDARPAADVERAGDAGSHRRLNVGLHDVSNIHEIARLLAVAEDGDRLASQHLEHEDRNDVAIRVETLTRAIHVEIAQANHLHAVQFRVGQALLLRAELAGAIWRVGLRGMIFANGQRLQLPENARGGRYDNLPYPRLSRGFENTQRPDHVDLR